MPSTDGHAHNVVIRHGLRPEGVHLEPRHLLGLCRGVVEHAWPAPSASSTATNAAPITNLRLFVTRSILVPSHGRRPGKPLPCKKAYLRAPVYLGLIAVSSFVKPSKLLSRLIVVVALLIGLGPVTSAHEVPNEVTVFGFVRPEGNDPAAAAARAAQVDARHRRAAAVQRLSGLFRVERPNDAAHDLDPGLRRALRERPRSLARPVVAAARVSLPSDRSFESYDAALANIITAPRIEQGTQLYWDKG